MSDLTLHLFGTPALLAGDGARLRFPDRRSVACLAVLAIDGPTPRSRLATLLWDEQGDADARRNLRRELHRMREAGLDKVFAADAETVALASGVATDLDAFAAALAEGDADRVLDLYAGGLLRGFDLAAAPAFADWLGARRESIAQRWREVAERRCEALADAGDMRGALREAHRLIADDSLQEAHFCRVMRLHQRLGEREAALDAFERCRKALGRELGLRPLPETVALAEAIRTSHADAAPPAPSAAVTLYRALVPERPLLVGREPTLAAIARVLVTGGSVAVEAAAGVGKSRLLAALVERGHVRRVHATHASDARVPFAALARWLRDARPAEDPPALPVWAAAELARFLPELGQAGDAPPTDLQRLRLYEAARLAWRSWCGTIGVPAFDDWQFVDAASALWWRWWRDQEPGPVVIGLRPGTAEGDVAEALAAILGAPGAASIALEPLDEAAMLELVRALSGSQRGERFARRLWRATGGNPLFAFETLAHLVETGVLGVDAGGRWATPFDDATEDYRELPIPPSVHAALAARVRVLGEAAQRLLEAASLIGDDFDLPLATSASALGEWEALRALEAALAARLVRRRDAAGGLFRFEHDLVAQTLQAAMAPERRALVHRALVGPLTQRGAPAARIAEHAERGGDRVAARRWRLLALDAARRRFALGDVLAEAERVLALDPSPAQAIAAHLARAAALQQRAERADAEAALAAATRLLDAADAASLHVAVMQERGVLAALSATPGSLEAELGQLLEDPRLADEDRARLWVTRGECRRVAGRLAEAEADWQLALAAFDPDNDEERGLVIERLARSLLLRGDSERARDQARAAIVLLERVGHAIGLARTHTLFGLLELLLGRPAEAAAALTRGRATAAAAGLVHLERSAILNLIPALHQLGDYEQAMRLVDEGLALSPLFTSPNEAQAFIEARHVCRYIAGDIGGALAAWPDLVRHTEGAGDVHRQCSGWLVAAELPLLLGDVTTAAPLLDRALAATAASEIKHLAVQTHAKAGWLALLRGDLAAATAALEAGRRIPDTSPDELSYLKTLELRLRRAGGKPGFDESAIRVSRSGATAEVWSLLLAAAIAWRHAQGGVAGTEVEDAFAELDSGKVPPLNALELLGALADAGRLDAGPGAVWRLRAHELASRLHASLSRHPRERAIFARRHARWLSARG